MKSITGLVRVAALAGVFTSASAYAAADMEKLDLRLQNARDVLSEIHSSPEKGVPENILSGASCLVVIPGSKKAALAVGAQYGQGVATCRNAKGWSGPVQIGD